MIEANITFDEYRVYDNIETSIKINSQIDGLLFYSPSGVNSYIKNNTITHEMCFCIGTTTADAWLRLRLPRLLENNVHGTRS